MTQPSLLDAVKPLSFTERVAQAFQNRPNQWIDGRELAQIGGAYAWRSRVSDCRKPPFNLRIDNRVRAMQDEDGRRWTRSEYCYVPEARA